MPVTRTQKSKHQVQLLRHRNLLCWLLILSGLIAGAPLPPALIESVQLVFRHASDVYGHLLNFPGVVIDITGPKDWELCNQSFVKTYQRDDNKPQLPELMIGAYSLLAGTLYYLGDIATEHQYAMRGLQIWLSGSVQSHAGELEPHGVVSLGQAAIFEWHLRKIASCQALIDELILLAKQQNDMSALALTLQWATVLAYCERN